MSGVGLESFYTIRSPSADDTSWQWLEFSARLAKAFGKGSEFALMDDELEPTKPLPFKVMQGRRPSDVWGNTAGLHLFSGRLVRLLQELKCTGFTALPAVLYDRNDRKVIDDDLFCLRIGYGAGPQDETKGEPLLLDFERRRNPELLEGCYGVYFDPTTWTGLDLFRLESCRSLALTVQRIATELLHADLTGVQVMPALEDGKEFCRQQIDFLKRRRVVR